MRLGRALVASRLRVRLVAGRAHVARVPSIGLVAGRAHIASGVGLSASPADLVHCVLGQCEPRAFIGGTSIQLGLLSLALFAQLPELLDATRLEDRGLHQSPRLGLAVLDVLQQSLEPLEGLEFRIFVRVLVNLETPTPLVRPHLVMGVPHSELTHAPIV